MLAWIGIALLSASWLPGLGYYHPADWTAWTAMVVLGTTLLAAGRGRLPGPTESGVAALLSLPAVWIAPWPYRAAFLGLAAGGAIGALRVAGGGWRLRRVQGSGFRVQGKSGKPAPAKLVAELCLPAAGHAVTPSSTARWLAAGLGRAAAALVLSGCILAAQGLALTAYETWTARSHELPSPLAKLVGAVAGALGMRVGVHESDVALYSYFRRPSLLGATWELLLDPATWAFLVGGIVLVVWRIWSAWPAGPAAGAASPVASPSRVWQLARPLVWFVVPILLWLPVRVGLLLAIYLHDLVWTDLGPEWAEGPLLPMRLFWSTPLHLVLLAGPVLLAWRFAPKPRPALSAPAAAAPAGRTRRGAATTPERRAARRLAAGLLAAAGAACFTAGVFWDPPGRPKLGRILTEENQWPGARHWEMPDGGRTGYRWERTRSDKVYDTQWYGELSGYNHYCIRHYTYHCYRDISTLPGLITDDALKRCDVLVLKCAARPYSEEEIDAVVRFVRRGGGLFLLGEHTNVYGYGAYLNPVARRFGFSFRYDCLYSIEKVFQQFLAPALVPHSIVQHVRGMEFATSCSIDPGTSSGRAAVRSVGLKNSMSDYHSTNLMPGPEDRSNMRFGAFIQLWAMRYGRGRVAAFTDSTIFSNFCVFEPGKREIWTGIIDWLNRRSPRLDPRYPLIVLAILLLGLGLHAARRWEGAWIVLVGCAVLGWGLAVVGVRAAQESAMPPPQPEDRPDCRYVEAVMDRTVCSVILPRSGFIDPRRDGFGIFERWILRLGYFTARLEAPEEFRGDPSRQVLVFLQPDLPVTDDFRRRVEQYVDDGGKVLVVEAPRSKVAAEPEEESATGPTLSARDMRRKRLAAATVPQTNALLATFGLSVVDYDARLSGPMQSAKGWPEVPVSDGLEVRGGTPFAWVNDRPVGTTLTWGRKGGSVTLVGFGSRLKDSQMGGTDTVDPDELPPGYEKLPPDRQQRILADRRKLKDVYQWEFDLLRELVAGTLAVPAANR